MAFMIVVGFVVLLAWYLAEKHVDDRKVVPCKRHDWNKWVDSDEGGLERSCKECPAVQHWHSGDQDDWKRDWQARGK